MRIRITIVLAIIMSVLFPVSVLGEQTFISGDFTYSVNENSQLTVTVTRYSGSPVDGLVVIPATVEDSGVTYTVSSLGDDLFQTNVPSQTKTRITKVEIPSSVTKIGLMVFANTDIESIDLPAGLVSIGASSFYSCKNLTEITIPDRVENIPKSLFYDATSLKKVVFGSSVKSIAKMVFDSRNTQIQLEQIEFRGTVVPEIPENTNIFNDYIKENAKVRVPSSVLEAYKASPLLSGFKNVEGYEQTEQPNSVMLHIRVPDSKVTLGMSVPYGEPYTISVGHDDGWVLDSVDPSDDNVEVTPESFTVRPTSDTHYTLSFKSNTLTEIVSSETLHDPVTLSLKGGIITLIGTDSAGLSEANVYSIDGTLLSSSNCSNYPHSICTVPEGISIVRIMNNGKEYVYKIVR